MNNQQIIKRYIEELNNRNFSVLDELLADEIVVDSKKLAPKEYTQQIENRISKFPDYHVTIQKIDSDGNKVILNWHREGTSSEGEKLSEDLTSEYTILNGKIVEVI